MSEKKMIALEPGLDIMAVIRTTFETLDLLSDEDSVRRELLDVIEQSRYELSLQVGGVADELESYPERFQADFEGIRDMAVDLATRGIPGRNLDSMMRTDSFDGVHFILDLPIGMDAKSARKMTGCEFLVRLLRHLHARVTDRGCCIDKVAFDRFVFQPYIAIMFVNYGTTEPLSYGRA